MDGDERYGVRQVCRELGIAVIAYSPLGECAGFENVEREDMDEGG
jgi:diketogulonate reductase-like aldo/keto reductase